MHKRNLQVTIGLTAVVSMIVSCSPAGSADQKATSAPAAAVSPAAAGATPAAPAATPKPAAAAASAEQPVYGGTFSLTLRDEPPSFDVHQESSAPSVFFVANATYNTLLTWDPIDHNKMVPDLAKKWEVSPDGLTYTFYLEEGAKWHDSAPFTAEDVRYSLMREKDPPKNMFSVSQFMFKTMESVEVVNPSTVKMRMSRPLASFPLMMSLGAMLFCPST